MAKVAYSVLYTLPGSETFQIHPLERVFRIPTIEIRHGNVESSKFVGKGAI
jgi:hypothetical protein